MSGKYNIASALSFHVIQYNSGSSWCVSFPLRKSGVFCFQFLENIWTICRCRAPPTDLNSKKFRSEERTWKADSQKEEKINTTHMFDCRSTMNI